MATRVISVRGRIHEYGPGRHAPALVPELGGKALACWCAPRPCHAEVPADLAETLP